MRTKVRRTPRPWLALGALAVLALLLVAGVRKRSRQRAVTVASLSGGAESPQQPAAASRPSRKATTVEGKRAYEYLVKICDIGPRPSGSKGLEQLRKLAEEHFQKLGAVVERQRFTARHPLTRAPVEMVNLLARWRPEETRRVLLAAHYDTRPYPDLEPDLRKRRDPFIGANDGASGVALLMELAHQVPALEVPYGIDFVLFDGEELVFGETGEYFLGSTHFAQQYRQDREETATSDQKPKKSKGAKRSEDRERAGDSAEYVAAVVIDMIGDRDLEIYQERSSLSLAPRLVRGIWSAARDLGVRELIPKVVYDIRDDHLPLNTIGDIPACVLIDFDYPAWHTTADTPEQCSGESLAKVGRVLLEWLKRGKF